jgi:putative nucleotidyltransferase with HDIG domain
MGILHVPVARFGYDTIAQADRALYLAKESGRNMVSTFGMTTIMETARQIAGMDMMTLRQRRRLLLDRLVDDLGPTQRSHVNGHCEQVAETAGRIATKLNMPQAEIDHVRLAGLLHDIGKTMIPEELLAKPSSLTIPERAVMNRHDRFGLWIAEALGAPESVLAHCRHHHTRFDRIGEDEVSLGAQIVCAADALVTMTSRRSYQAAISGEKAMLELLRERGRQFAPVVVDTCSMLDAVAPKVAA